MARLNAGGSEPRDDHEEKVAVATSPLTPRPSAWWLGLQAVGAMIRTAHRGSHAQTTHTYGPLYSSAIRPSQQDSLLYTQFSHTHLSSISYSIHSIHYRTHLSLYLNISMCDLVSKDLLRRI
jgi:hypothetical protein